VHDIHSRKRVIASHLDIFYTSLTRNFNEMEI